MKTFFACMLLFSSTVCLADSAWVPVSDVPSYPQVVVPTDPVVSYSTVVTRPHIYYQWTPYYYLSPIVVEQRGLLFVKKYTTKYIPVTGWIYQPYILP